MKKRNFETIKKDAEKYGFILLSDKYESRKSLKFQCSKGHVFETRVDLFEKNHSCSWCSRKKQDINSVRIAFEKEGYELLSPEYKNKYGELNFICPKGHVGKTKWVYFQNGFRCRDCARGVRRCDFDTVKNGFEKEGYKLLTKKEDYIGNEQLLEFICPKNHKHKMSWGSFSQGHRCGKCNPNYPLNLKDIRKCFEKEGYKLLSEKYEGKDELLQFICPKGHRHQINWNNFRKGVRCGKCYPHDSRQQQDFTAFLKSVYKGSIQENTYEIIPPKEIDVYLPEKKLAFEYCGLYWHSEKAGKDINYHADKLRNCKDRGIRLITVFEDEWLNKREIVESRIKSILGLNKVIYGRSCEISQVDNKTAVEFCEENHLQGKDKPIVSYGLFFKGELVAIMTFSKYSIAKGLKAKEDEWELDRFCSKAGVNVVGGASKLYKKFKQDWIPKKVISYCDLRWGTGVMYEKLGMIMEKKTQPNYFYVGEENKRKHRFGFRKSVLVEKYGADKDKTEKEITEEMGLYRIYDCGHKKFTDSPRLN